MSGFEAAYKSLVISEKARLGLNLNRIQITQAENDFFIPLKDIYIIILESKAVMISSALLSALAQERVVLLTCDASHHPDGIFCGFLSHNLSAKIAREQLDVSQKTKAMLWQSIVKNKIENQAAVLKLLSFKEEGEQLLLLAKGVKLNDGSNMEARAAALYFKLLLTSPRTHGSSLNYALNYSYAILRAAFARAICISGLLPYLGIKHRNIYNPFALCDDLIEAFRPIADLHALTCITDYSSTEKLTQQERLELLEILDQVIILENKKIKIKTAIIRYVQIFKKALLENFPLEKIGINE